MLPAGVLTKRVVGPHGTATVVVGVRWFRKYVATTHPPEPKRYYARSGNISGTSGYRILRLDGRYRNVNPYAGYCSRGDGKKVVPFLLADIGEGIREVTVKEWYVNVGDSVQEFDDICEVESDKATVTITSRYKGIVVKRHCESDGMAQVGSALVDIEVDDVKDGGETVNAVNPAPEVEVAEVSSAVVDSVGSNAGKVLTTPAVRRIAAEKGIDLTTVRGTGKQGRVLKEDLLGPEWSSPVTAVSGPPPSPSPARSSSPTATPQDYMPLTGYAKTMRNTMEASNKIPALVITDEVNLTRMTELKAELSSHVKLTLLPFLLKATSLALTRHPIINSTVGQDFMSYRPNGSHNIGVAIDTPLGLAVPNIKGVEALTVVEVARRLADLRAKAQAGKLAPVDVTGGTFTLSNLGSIAGSVFRPMILPPEVAIGALGRMKYRPRYNDQQQLVRTPVMDVSWAADHRILDGATVARFFKDWKTYVENPSLILAGVELDRSVK